MVAGDIVKNTTDGSQGIVASLSATQITLTAALTGGTANTFAAGDAYQVVAPESSTVLTDSTASFGASGVVAGDIVKNTTDGSQGIVASLSATQITLTAALTGGTANTFAAGDAYQVVAPESSTVLTDSTASFGASGVVAGDIVKNTTDGSQGIVASLSATQITLTAALTGGTANTFAAGDAYQVVAATVAASATQLNDASATFIADGVVAGSLVTNTTDGSTGTVATVDSETHITLTAALAGGTANTFASGDEYAVGEVALTSLAADSYLVHLDLGSKLDANGDPIYKVTREEDINIGNGDSFVPQVPPPSCAGSLHQVDVAGDGTDGYAATTLPDPSDNGGASIAVPASTPTDNLTFVGIGASPYEGTARPLCDTKLVDLQNGKSIVPMFNVFTDVPLPGRFFFYNVDDLNFSTDPKSLLYGEKAGMAFNPVGVYDWANRLVTTVETDYNGLADVLLPSTNRINCPTPSGVCANLYRFVGNDPGVPGRLNLNYNPQYRTIAAEFEAFPGLIVPADTAPTQMSVSIQLPGSQQQQAVACPMNPVGATPTVPELFTVSQPYGRAASSFTITGRGFGSGGAVQLRDGTNPPVTLATSGWTDTGITATVPAATAGGAYQMTIRRTDNGKATVNGLTFHVTTAPAVGAFPAVAILDNFNRANNNAALGAGWADDAPNTIYNVNGNQARVRTGNPAGAPGRDAWRSGANAVYGTNQEAYFTFVQVSNAATADEQGLLLKYSGGADPNALAAQWIEVTKDNSPANTVRIATKTAGSATITTQATLTGPNATFGAGDRLGARALNDGTIVVYKNGTQAGTASLPFTANWFGSIGVRFEGTGTTAATEARFDNFGGGTLATTGGYSPNIYQVGPGKAYDPGTIVIDVPNHAIQNALNDAAASPGDDLVVVYPGTPQGARVNPRGAYYENLIVYAPVKIQGVGPGGIYPDGTPVTGSIIDGSAYGGDTLLADDWRALLASQPYDGNQDVGEGATITMVGSNGEYGTAWKAGIDGLDIRGGNFTGFPGNIDPIGGGPTGQPVTVQDQGGGLYLNAYIRNAQVTNNIFQSNAGAYAGGIRVGTPNLPAPDTNQHNENLRIANNRLLANAGTNLAGGIGIFAGADGYDIAQNDICANFSAEYGGGISAYGLSPNGKIHDNRVYFNRSYDEGGGIMVAGELPASPTVLSPGSGPVDIYVEPGPGQPRQRRRRRDPVPDGRQLPDQRLRQHDREQRLDARRRRHRHRRRQQPADLLQHDHEEHHDLDGRDQQRAACPGRHLHRRQQRPPPGSLPAGSPAFSDPILFNNVLSDNRSGSRGLGTVLGIGSTGDATPINRWDMGVADGTGLLSPTNSLFEVTTGTNASPTNVVSPNPGVVSTYDVALTFSPWRTNPNFVGAILVAVDVPPALLGDYHLQATSAAVNLGAASKSGVNAPTVDIDGDYRPNGLAQDAGADELSGGAPPSGPTLPALTVLDNFNRGNANTLGAQLEPGDRSSGRRAIRVNANQAFANNAGSAIWNVPAGGFGAKPGRRVHLRQHPDGPDPACPAAQGERRDRGQPGELHQGRLPSAPTWSSRPRSTGTTCSRPTRPGRPSPRPSPPATRSARPSMRRARSTCSRRAGRRPPWWAP